MIQTSSRSTRSTSYTSVFNRDHESVLVDMERAYFKIKFNDANTRVLKFTYNQNALSILYLEIDTTVLDSPTCVDESVCTFSGALTKINPLVLLINVSRTVIQPYAIKSAEF